MYPFEDTIDTLEQVEPGVYLEHVFPDEVQEISTEYEQPQLIFGSLEKSEGIEIQAGVLDDAVACYSACAPELGAQALSQQQLIDMLKAEGLYTDGCGMSEKDVEHCFMRLAQTDDTKVYVECEELNGLNELCIYVDSGDVVICYVNAAALESDSLAQMPGLNADHFVRVSGVDLSGENEYVHIQDSASLQGETKAIPLGRFLKAWNTGNFYTITAHAREK
ncbi:MAG: hypothetical protein IKE65_02340 [Clostridia bacterium]|nr:hypothetical protein [Clostridia bacterium]